MDTDAPYSKLYEFIFQSSEGIEERIATLDKSTLAAWKILDGLDDRKGFDWWFDDIDPDIQDEIFHQIRTNIKTVFPSV